MSAARQRPVPGGSTALKPPARSPEPGTVPPALPPPPNRGEVPAAEPARVPVVAEVLAPPPPAPQKVTREQFNSKIKADLRRRLNKFVDSNGTNLQLVLEAALDEYMARRGWTWEDYNRSVRRGD